MQQKSLQVLYSPLPTLEKAKEIAHHLLEKELCVCCNIFPEIQSVYIWKGMIEEANEVVLIVKTMNPESAKDELLKVHPYEEPCILQLRNDI